MSHLITKKSSSFTSTKSSTSKSQVSKFLTGFKPTKKKKVGKSSQFTSKKSSKKFSLKKFTPLKKSSFTFNKKQTTKKPRSSFLPKLSNKSFIGPIKPRKKFGKKPQSVFTKSKKSSKDTPEISAFIASKSIPKFKKGKVGKSGQFSKQKKQVQLPTFAGSITSIIKKFDLGKKSTAEEQTKQSTSEPKTSPFLPSKPEPTSGDDTNFFDDIAEFFNNFFGGSGASSQQQASDSGSITTFEFSPVTLPSQETPNTGTGLVDIEPRESFGLGIGGISPDGEGDDKDGILNSIVNDPVKLGLSITAIIGIIAGFTGGK